MTTKKAVEDFLRQPVLAVAGVSRDPKKFGSLAYREFKARGYRVLAVNPNVQTIEGDPCYPSLSALPEPVGGLFLSTRPDVSEKLVREAAEMGIRHLWLQQGAESRGAIQIGQQNGLNVISGECIMMYLPRAAFPHNLHRFIKEALGNKLS